MAKTKHSEDLSSSNSAPKREIFQWKGHEITFIRWPSTNPKNKEKIVLIGGWCSTTGYWKLVIPFFQTLGEVIELDLIGHFPARFLQNFTRIQLKDFLEAQAESVWHSAGYKEVSLVGHSTGGMAVMALSALFPERIKQTVTIAPYVHGPVKGPLKFGVLGLRGNLGLFFDFGFKLGRNIPKFLDFGFSFGVADSKRFHSNPEIVAFLKEYEPEFQNLEARNMLMLLEMLDRTDIRPLLFGNKVPMLLIRGDEDPVVSPKDLIEIERGTPALSSIHFADCGHFVHLEKPREFQKVVHDFFSEKRNLKK